MTDLRALHLAILLLGACGGDDDGGSPDAAGSDPDAAGAADAGDVDGGATGADGGFAGGVVQDRPYGLFVPGGHDGATPIPLVVLLHGYSATGSVQLLYFGMEEVAQERTLLVAFPDGTVDSEQNQFWNATDACCDFDGSGIDDVDYLTAVIDDVKANYDVDPARVYAVGHSNGGFMSHRLACDRAGQIAAIASLAGATWADPAQCQPSAPVAVLQVHGDADDVILYGGGSIGTDAYPAAAETVATWAEKNGCSGALAADDERLDLDQAVAGDETRVERTAGCPGTSAEVELWTLEGSGHVPQLVRPGFAAAIADFLLAHPRK